MVSNSLGALPRQRNHEVMPNTAYNTSLKGYAGGIDIDRATIDKELAKNTGKRAMFYLQPCPLSQLFNFKKHGNVYVHFIGLNASAATIVSLGAVHISIDARAIYLVYQYSMTMSYVMRLFWCESRDNPTILCTQYIIQ